MRGGGIGSNAEKTTGAQGMEIRGSSRKKRANVTVGNADEVRELMAPHTLLAVHGAAVSPNSTWPPGRNFLKPKTRKFQAALAAIVRSQGKCTCSQEDAAVLPTLIYHPRGGLGNEMLGMASAAVLAALLCRRFAVAWGSGVNHQAKTAYEDLFQRVPGVTVLQKHDALAFDEAALNRTLYDRLRMRSAPHPWPIKCSIELTQRADEITAAALAHVLRACNVLDVTGNQYFVPMLLGIRGGRASAAAVQNGWGVGCNGSPALARPTFAQAYFGSLSSRLLVPHEHFVSRADKWMASLRANVSGAAAGPVAIIGVHVRSVLLEFVAKSLKGTTATGELLDKSGFMDCIHSVRNAARAAGFAASKVYLSSDVSGHSNHRLEGPLEEELGADSVAETPQYIKRASELVRRMTSVRGYVSTRGALDEMLLLARSDAMVVWDLRVSSYSAVAASWAVHRAAGQDVIGERPRPWLGVHIVDEGCARMPDDEVDPPVTFAADNQLIAQDWVRYDQRDGKAKELNASAMAAMHESRLQRAREKGISLYHRNQSCAVPLTSRFSNLIKESCYEEEAAVFNKTSLQRPFASGLQWHKAGNERPRGGTALTNGRLSEALMRGKTDFSREEWAEFGITTELRVGDFIKVDDAYFRAWQIEQEQQKLRPNATSATAQRSSASSGLRWRKVGNTPPLAGRALTNHRLAAALTRKVQHKRVRFSSEEWAAFGITGLHTGDFIEASDAYFVAEPG